MSHVFTRKSTSCGLLELELLAFLFLQKLEVRLTAEPPGDGVTVGLERVQGFLVRDFDRLVAPAHGGRIGEELNLTCLLHRDVKVQCRLDSIARDENTVVLGCIIRFQTSILDDAHYL